MFLRTNVVCSSPVHFNWFFSPSRFLSSNDLHLWRRREIPSPSSLMASSTLPISYTHLHEQGAHLPNAPNFYDLSSPLSSLFSPSPAAPATGFKQPVFLFPLSSRHKFTWLPEPKSIQVKMNFTVLRGAVETDKKYTFFYFPYTIVTTAHTFRRAPSLPLLPTTPRRRPPSPCRSAPEPPLPLPRTPPEGRPGSKRCTQGKKRRRVA